MAKQPEVEIFEAGLIDQPTLFSVLFSAASLQAAFRANFEKSAGKGTDRVNGFQFALRAPAELAAASTRCLAGTYRFAPYLEVLKAKGRNKYPRLIGIPTIRDRVVLSQLNVFLSALFPEKVPRNVASTYVRAIANELRVKDQKSTWVCSTDIKTFYDSIERARLLKVLEHRVKCSAVIALVRHALQTPTVPKNTRRSRHAAYRVEQGVPQGLAVSNILASIYLADVDEAMRALPEISYYRYVDDVLIYGAHDPVQAAYRSLAGRLKRRKLQLHSPSSGKTQIEPLARPFGYLGYRFNADQITVREATVERFLQSVAGKFSDFTHNKARRLEKFKYLTEARLAEIFLAELNERISGAVSEKKRYGWIAYFSQITDLTLLHRLDHTIANFFGRLSEFGRSAPAGLKRLSRALWEMKFNPQGGYVRDYDQIQTRVEKLNFLVFRGRVGPGEALTDEQIDDRYEKYVHDVLSAMHADEGAVY